MKKNKDSFKVGTFYEYTEIMPPLDDMLGDIVEVFTGSRESVLSIEGPIIFNDGTTAIVKVKSQNMELDVFTLYYEEVRQRFKGFVDNEEKFSMIQKYFCVDIQSGESRFYKDLETDEIHEARFDENGDFLGYDYDDEKEDIVFNNQSLESVLPTEAYNRLKEWHALISSGGDISVDVPRKMIISLDPSTVLAMEASGLLELVEDDEVDYRGFNRALKWLAQCDCAIVTAWNDETPRKVNDQNNRVLQETLRDLGYGVYKVKGYYTSTCNKLCRENSFLVFDQKGTNNLRDDVYFLSEKYNQECFLFCAKGCSRAILIGTNDKFGKGKCVELGQIEINNHCRGNYSEIGNGIISFGE